MSIFKESITKIGEAVGMPNLDYDVYRLEHAEGIYFDVDFVTRVMHKVYEVKNEYDADGNLTTYFKLRQGFPDIMSFDGKSVVPYELFMGDNTIYADMNDLDINRLMEWKALISFAETTAVMDFYKMYLKNNNVQI